MSDSVSWGRRRNGQRKGLKAFERTLAVVAIAISGAGTGTLAGGCAAVGAHRLPTSPHLAHLTEAQVFAMAPPAAWPNPGPDDPRNASVQVACGVGPRLAEGTIYGAVSVQGRPSPGSVAPFNVSLVLDRSGSMSGQPFDNMLRAAASFISQLRDGDRVSVVVFSDGVYEAVPPVVVGPSTRSAALAQVAALRDGGGTFLSGGLLAGLAQVFGSFSEWQVNQVVLFSDGQPNIGITDTNALAAIAERAAEHGVGVTTIGFGHLHDELLMQTLADAGGGTYHYVENPGDIPQIFQREATAMLRTAVRSTYVAVDVPPSMVVDDVLGYDYIRGPGGRLYVRMGGIPFGEERYVVLKMRPQGQPSAILPLTVSYADLTRRARFQVGCAPTFTAAAGGNETWALELAGRAEAAWGLAEAMGWADTNSEVFAISQLAHTRGIIASLRERIGPGALAAEDQMLEGAQGRLGFAVASGAASSFLSGGMRGLVSFGTKTAVDNTAAVAASKVDASFRPLVRAGVQMTFYGQPAMRYSARAQRPFKLYDLGKSNRYKQARFDAYVMMRVRPGR